ncbi:unnamed protein product [Clonostachys rosea]|uniref:Uncharacterized protein n=1 Tax=Bionectria ochroleuca TaxID=29856 RepID=A0ABY6TMP3_BIOOC|nr:unnamed protein product [Clonostachys rosea]
MSLPIGTGMTSTGELPMKAYPACVDGEFANMRKSSTYLSSEGGREVNGEEVGGPCATLTGREEG